MKIESIKFKAKRLDGKGWVCGYFYEENGNTYIIENRQKESMLNRNITYQVDPSTVCQFTGLKDCEGKEVWDHDLLQSQGTGVIYEVSWSQDEGGFIVKESVCGARLLTFLCAALTLFGLKVIGNKFDKKK